MKSIKKILGIALVFFAFVVSCSKKEGPQEPEESEITVTAIHLTANVTSLQEGNTTQLSTSIEPDNAAKVNVLLSSSNEDIATVDKTGLVTGISAGEVTITAVVEGNSKITDTVQLEITKEPSGSNNITSFIINDIAGTIEDTTISIELSADTAITALAPVIVHTGKSIAPASGTAQDFTDPVVYTVTAENGDTMEFTVTVSLKQIPIESITLNASETSIQIGSNLQLNLNIAPVDTTDEVEVVFSSSDENLATVDENGLVTAVALGEVTITATSKANAEIKDTMVLQLIDTTSFVTTWSAQEITVPTDPGFIYDYNVDWNNDGIFDEFGITGNVTHTFDTAGEHTIRISGTFPAIRFGDVGEENLKIINVDQWGTGAWKSMSAAFRFCGNLKVTAADVPDLSGVFDAQNMFAFAEMANPDVSNWNTSSITNMLGMFLSTKAATPDVSSWDTGQVTKMGRMFRESSANPDISNWDVQNVTDMSEMFFAAKTANPDMSKWNISSVTKMKDLFNGSGISQENYEKALIRFAAHNNDTIGNFVLPQNINLGLVPVSSCSAEAKEAKTKLQNNGWTINEQGSCN